MKIAKSILAPLLCVSLVLCIAACAAPPTPLPAPAETTPPTTQPAPTEPPEVIDAIALYNKAQESLQAAIGITVHTTQTENRLVNGEVFTESVTGTASYGGLGTDHPVAMVSQRLEFGTFACDYLEFYQNGIAHASADGSTFQKEMPFDEFRGRQIPLLPDASLYEAISATRDGSNTVIAFTQPTALEAWVTDIPGAALSDVTAAVTVSGDGQLLSCSYEAAYTCGSTAYTLKFTASVSLDPPEYTPPEIPENCPTLNSLDIPRLIFRIVGDIYSAQSVTASRTDSLYSQALSMVRTQTGSFDLYGAGPELIGKIHQQVSVTDYTNTPKITTETATYINGVYTTGSNGGDLQTVEGVTPEDIRIYCEDELLSPLMTLDLIREAALTSDGDFLYITLTGNDTFSRKLCDWIYGLLQMDLDQWAASYTTEIAQGCLCINRQTGLPASITLEFARTHISGTVPYELTYRLEESLLLASPSAYENITGSVG